MKMSRSKQVTMPASPKFCIFGAGAIGGLIAQEENL